MRAAADAPVKEAAMPNRVFWNKSVPRVEYDHRARDARLGLEQVERALVKQVPAPGSRYFGLLRLLAGNIAGSARRRREGTGSPSDRRPCAMISRRAGPGGSPSLHPLTNHLTATRPRGMGVLHTSKSAPLAACGSRHLAVQFP